MKVTRALTVVWRWLCLQALKILLWARYRQSRGKVISLSELAQFNCMMLRARDCHAMNQVRFPQHMEHA
jgi:hypothetical protein